ncbi:MAG: hypothetical protein WC358_11040, partial [Ignavibacteria bacterium]
MAEENKINSYLEMFGNTGTDLMPDDSDPDKKKKSKGFKVTPFKFSTDVEDAIKKSQPNQQQIERFQEIFNTAMPIIKAKESVDELRNLKEMERQEELKPENLIQNIISKQDVGNERPLETSVTETPESIKSLTNEMAIERVEAEKNRLKSLVEKYPEVKKYYDAKGISPEGNMNKIDVDKNGKVIFESDMNDDYFKNLNNELSEAKSQNITALLKEIENKGLRLPPAVVEQGYDEIMKYLGQQKTGGLENIIYQNFTKPYYTVEKGIENILGLTGKKLFGLNYRPTELPSYTSGNESLDFFTGLPTDLILLSGGIKLGSGLVNMSLGKFIKNKLALKFLGEGTGFVAKNTPQNLSNLVTGKTDPKTYTIQTIGEFGTGGVFALNPFKSFGGRVIYNSIAPTLTGH